MATSMQQVGNPGKQLGSEGPPTPHTLQRDSAPVFPFVPLCRGLECIPVLLQAGQHTLPITS